MDFYYLETRCHQNQLLSQNKSHLVFLLCKQPATQASCSGTDREKLLKEHEVNYDPHLQENIVQESFWLKLFIRESRSTKNKCEGEYL